MSYLSDWLATNPGKGGLLANAEFVLSQLDKVPTSYAPTVHTHTKSQITDFTHTHIKSQITDFTHTHTDLNFSIDDSYNIISTIVYYTVRQNFYSKFELRPGGTLYFSIPATVTKKK